MVVREVLNASELDADELKAIFLMASGSSAALEACKQTSQSLEKKFARWLVSTYHPSLPYSSTRENIKDIIDILSANISSTSWYGAECHQPALGITLAKHIQYVPNPTCRADFRYEPIRVICFDTGVPLDLIGSLLAICKTQGKKILLTTRFSSLTIFVVFFSLGSKHQQFSIVAFAEEEHTDIFRKSRGYESIVAIFNKAQARASIMPINRHNDLPNANSAVDKTLYLAPPIRLGPLAEYCQQLNPTIAVVGRLHPVRLKNWIQMYLYVKFCDYLYIRQSDMQYFNDDGTNAYFVICYL